MGMDTRTGEIRELKFGEKIRDNEVLLSEVEAKELKKIAPAQRLQTYEQMRAGGKRPHSNLPKSMRK